MDLKHSVIKGLSCTGNVLVIYQSREYLISQYFLKYAGLGYFGRLKLLPFGVQTECVYLDFMKIMDL